MIWKSKRSRHRKPKGSVDAVKRRAHGPERLEQRRLLAADPVHVGVVYLETDYLETDQDVGSDSRGDRFILSFTGGAEGTELTELRIRTDKDADGISVGDPIFDTELGGRGKNGAHGFEIVRTFSTDNRTIRATAVVDDGGQELVLRLTNFQAGDRLEFTLDVDEVLRNAADLETFNSRLDVITSGQEFQDSILQATFDAPHYETSHADAVFLNDFGDPADAYGLDLPADESDDPDSRPNRSAAAVASAQQTPKPIDITGQVWIDNNLDQVRQPGESPIAGVEIALWKRTSNGNYTDTGLRAATDADGKYRFAKSLGLQPGTYRVVQTQPRDLFSVGAVLGTVNGQSAGSVESDNVLTEIAIPLGDSSARGYDFAEAEPVSLSGFVYQDDDNDGRRDPDESGIAGIRVRLVPLETIASQTAVTVTTRADGSYSFTGLPPGTYSIVELDQPSHLNDGIDAAGRVRGQVVGVATNPGDRIDQIALTGADVGVEYNFGEVPFGSLSGYVYLAAPGSDCVDDHNDAGHSPLAGVRLILRDDQGSTIAETTTGSDGKYFFDDLPVGTYRLSEVTPSGLFDGGSHVGRIDDVAVGTSVDGGLIDDIVMTPAGVGVEYNFCEAAPASLSGFVYHDRSGDGNRNSGESPVAGVAITLVDAKGKQVAVTQTDADGRYRFDQLKPGTYTVVESQPDGYLDGRESVGTVRGRKVGNVDRNDAITVTLKQGDEGVNYNFGELLPASLFGRVHVDADGDCEYDEGETTLADVTMRLLNQDGQEVARTTTDAAGRYSFRDIEPGQYTVVQDQPQGYFEGMASPGTAGGTAIGGSRIANIVLASGETAVEYDFCERPPAEIAGSVFDDGDGDCLLDPGEVGIAGVEVQLYDKDGSLVATASTDASGHYRFTNLPAGMYTIRETQPAGWLQGGQRAGSGGGDDSQPDRISAIPVGWGDRLTQYNFCELRAASIGGMVFVDGNGDCLRDADEPPLAGVTIELRDAGGRFVATTTTDAEGQYRFDQLTPGQYQIMERQPTGYFQGGQTPGSGEGRVLGTDLLGATLGPGQMLVDYNFCEVAPSSIGGHVWQETDANRHFDPGEIPVPGVLVDLLDDGGRVVAQTRTDSEGHYEFRQLAPGVYSVRESQPDDLFHGGQVVGNAGGSISQDDWIVGITLTGATKAEQYNFPEAPPALLSGYVFQDGEAILVADLPDPTELRQYRDGQFTEDDTPIVGVTLELRDEFGLPVNASAALKGVYAEGAIRVSTDADGYFELRGLPSGTYHLYQVQPEEYFDGLDTPGTAGGVAVNLADTPSEADRELIERLASDPETDPGNDGILNIRLSPGQESRSNYFSEIAVAVQQVPLPVVESSQPERMIVPIETFDPRIRLVTYAEPATYKTTAYANDDWGVSWHLSVINGGYPRGALGREGVLQTVSSSQRKPDWSEGAHARGRWMIASRDGSILELSDPMMLGDEDAIALAGDFDGDGVDEPVIFVGGHWYVDLNGNGRWDVGDLWIQLGTELDRPIIGDWDGDGKDDIGIFGRQWHHDPQRIRRDPGLPDPDNVRRRMVEVRTVATTGEGGRQVPERLLRRPTDGFLRADVVDHVFQYGVQVDTPVAGDWNGDGIDQIAVFRDGHWMLDVDGDGRWTDSDLRVEFGQPGDQPVVGDFNGDDLDEIAVVRGDLWIIDTDGDRRLTGNDLRIVIPRSDEASQPVVGDFDGDGKDEPGYYDEEAA